MKKFLFFAASAVLLVACNSKPGYKITGSVSNPDLNGQYVYLYEYGNMEESPKDSALVENGTFIIEGQQNNPALYMLSFSEDVVPPKTVGPGESDVYSTIFVLENANLTAKLDSSSTVTGTPENESLKAYNEGIDKLNKEAAPHIEKGKNYETMAEKDKAELRKLYNDLFAKRMKLAKDYIDNNLHKLSGAYLFSQYCSFMGLNDQDATLTKADSTFKSVPGIDQISKQVEVMKKVAPGQKFTDFTAVTPEGKSMMLSDYAGKGKYVLVDFWASWCPPCRVAMPQIAELYKQYGKKGLEIVGVSLDDDSTKWKAAIKEMKMTWPQISDLKGWQSEAAMIYGVSTIPQTVLINPEGIIVASGLHDAELDAKIKELLK